MTGRRLPADAALELHACGLELGIPAGGELARALGRERGLRVLATLAGVEFLPDPPLPPAPGTLPQVDRPTWIERGFGRAIPDVERDGVVSLVAGERCAVVPLLAVFEGLVPQVEDRAEMLLDARLADIVPPFRLLWGFHGHGLRRFVPTNAIDAALDCARFQQGLSADLDAAGVTLAAGSGAMLDFVWPGAGLVAELEAWCAAGLNAERVLRGATADAARALHVEGGVLAVGAPADLLLLERDPRADVGRLRGVVGVAARGRWLDAAAIEAERARRAASYPAEAIDVDALVPKDVRAALAAIVARGGGLVARDEAWQRLAELLVDVDRAKDAEYLARAAIERAPSAWWGH
jgi:hypothetical protein